MRSNSTIGLISLAYTVVPSAETFEGVPKLHVTLVDGNNEVISASEPISMKVTTGRIFVNILKQKWMTILENAVISYKLRQLEQVSTNVRILFVY